MRTWRQFLRDTKAVAATEFALAAPILLTLMLSGYETTRFIQVHQKVEKVSYTVSDVVSQNKVLTQAQLGKIVQAAGEIMQPHSFSGAGQVIITSVSKTGNNPPIVRWRYTGGGTLNRTSAIGALNQTATLPGGLTLNDKDNVIITEVFYAYTPLLTGTVISADDIYKTAIFKPRLGALTTPPA